MKAIKPIKAEQTNDRWNVHPTADCCSLRESELHAIDKEIRTLSSRMRTAPVTDRTPWQTSRSAVWKSGLPESEKRYAEHQLAIAEEYANGATDSPPRLIGAALFHLRQLRSRLKSWFVMLCCTSNEVDFRPTTGAIETKRSCCTETASSKAKQQSKRSAHLIRFGAAVSLLLVLVVFTTRLLRETSIAVTTVSSPVRSQTYTKGQKMNGTMMSHTIETASQYRVNISQNSETIAAGKPATMQFSILDPAGELVKTLETVHDKKLHLLMVSNDLAWFAHEHPKLLPDGSFAFSYTFPEAGEMAFYFDFTPSEMGQQVVQVPVRIDGTTPDKRSLSVDADMPKTIDGYTVELAVHGLPTTTASARMSYTLMKDGQPVTNLQPYLGAMGHLVIISSDLQTFVHAHPTDHAATGDHHPQHHADQGHHHMHDIPPSGGPMIEFEAHFHTPGIYKSWAQFQLPGEDINDGSRILTVPMTFEVF